MTLKDNLDSIYLKIEEAKSKSPYKEEVKLIAVSKTIDIDIIQASIRDGVVAIGENKVQEFVKKYEALKDNNIEFHMIGNLQSNKVKDLVHKVDLVHSLDRLSVLKQMERRGGQEEFIFNCLIQVNISKEESKSGVYVEDLYSLINEVEKCNWVKVHGLMTMAPHFENSEDTRPVFKKARAIYDELKNKNFKNTKMTYLSMGMTNDYPIAIEEGSNMIRLGSAIYGKRNYNKKF